MLMLKARRWKDTRWAAPRRIEKLRMADPFDKAFSEAMIPRDEQSVAAANLAQQQSEHAELKERIEGLGLIQLFGWEDGLAQRGHPRPSNMRSNGAPHDRQVRPGPSEGAYRRGRKRSTVIRPSLRHGG